jgi:predicted lipoprotein with Yx(FWY)xxD motif
MSSTGCRTDGLENCGHVVVSRKRYLGLIAPLGVAGMVACGATKPNATPTPLVAPTPSSAPTAVPSSAVPTVDIGTTSIGTVLTDANGHTLYYFSMEANGQDECTLNPGCAVMWPAVSPPGDSTPVPGIGVDGTLGVVSAADGGPEVTYNGWPLHTFSGEAAGQLTGEGMASFGGTWAAATPDMAPTSNSGGGDSAPGLVTPPAITPPGALPTNPFAPTTPPGIPVQPPLPTIPSALPTNPF